MSVLIIGADSINPIKSVLENFGVTSIMHWNARDENKTNKRRLPEDIDCLIMLTNFLNHNTMFKFKKEAKKVKLPFICAERTEHSVNSEFCKKFGLIKQKENR